MHTQHKNQWIKSMNPQHGGRKPTETPVMLKRDIPSVVLLYEVFLLGKGKVLLLCYLDLLFTSHMIDAWARALRVATKE